jgi:glucose/arabinose dehydrogenase
MRNKIHISHVVLLGVALILPARANSATTVAEAFPALPEFTQPIDIQDPRDGTDRLFVVERPGRLVVFENDPATSTRTVFLDIADSVTTQVEGGLLGLAFHNNYESNGYLYVLYTAASPRRTIVARFTASGGNPDLADPNSELRILELPKTNLFHNGGCLAFGADGYLYISLGDDGQTQLSQNLSSLAGKLLRIDVDNPGAGIEYGIPQDNPFAGNQSGYREEIFAFGFRNPWRFSLDADDGTIWLGDVGQGDWEEVDVVRKGRNYGWPRMEGNMCYSPSTCDTNGLNIDLPVFEYSHAGGAAVTGGYVYRGPSLPSLFGKYIYADYIRGTIWALSYNGVDPPVNATVHGNPSPGAIGSFGTDVAGELYFASFDGNIYRFFETATAVGTPPPPVGALGLVHPNPFQTTASIEYTVAASSRTALEVFDIRGRRVAALFDRTTGAGSYTAFWNGSDDNGIPLPSGVYVCRLTVDGAHAAARRVLLLR